MHIPPGRQVELRYALLKSQAQELTITEFLSLYIKNEQELCWVYHWLKRHTAYQQSKLSRQFELHRLIAAVLDEKEDIAQLSQLSQEETLWIKQVLTSKIKALEAKAKADQGEPIRYNKGGRQYAGDHTPSLVSSSAADHLQSTSLAPIQASGQYRMEGYDPAREEEEGEIDNGAACSSEEDLNRHQSSKETLSPICELPAPQECTDDE